mmetsp:Transcript_7074/g.15595  ORF Transcript_7074/g.15595 Transcript_7074/m.15595 type:complete len:137 (+) Transcript_7074:1909-2319(+)
MPVTQSPTNPPTPNPTNQPVTPSPTRNPVTASPTVPVNCEAASITEYQCIAAPNCKWVKFRGSKYCEFSPVAPSPPTPTPPSPTPPTTTPQPTPNPTQPSGGGGGSCLPRGSSCDLKASNPCCGSCSGNGRWGSCS